ncbi:glycoside hydrolase family 13 protein [Humibacter ginsenosidimutans]|uniref:Glycoside hydrolase family 13 protein n=1 Tax=Humibacter ginsenosidimutans TaxID=2599293 RepID=A0A5B8M678_9MICO|nr:glycoside hydrolase family 13 protein [Humibacter ginsenosidimutans]QDZ16107.1 glycoside hydrolase family 13 protein [Humibacter ginsenosidimutans]
MASTGTTSTTGGGHEWWRTAVIYQVYPRSFADANGDGVGDLPGITAHLPELQNLGVDAVWLSPFMTSPQRDAGYDVADYCDVDPLFGTLDDFDRMLEAAHGLGLRVIIDLVPNHTSSDHVWFKDALASSDGSPERGHYWFRDGKGENGDEPPNNWESVFGGPAWTRVTNPDGTPGQWYLHLFDTSQPDLNWTDPWVWEQFRGILRFWLDRGVDGFRIDVAHGMVKADGLPDATPDEAAGSMGGAGGALALEPEISDEPPSLPYWGQEGGHEIFRDWHKVLAEYDGDRALCGEAWVDPPAKLARYVRPDEMQQTFNFSYLETPWQAPALRTVIADSLAAFNGVGAPSTWVLSNHDVVRHATRLGVSGDNPQGHGLGPKSNVTVDAVTGLRRARAATTVMLALPGSAYLFQGEELGLPEVIDLPDSARQDPTWFRTDGERYGRDGCRVPIPWTAAGPSFGFNDTGASWLPQPAIWALLARDAEELDPDSTLALYKLLLAEREGRGLGAGELEWLKGFGDDVVAFRNGGVTVVANLGEASIALPDGEVVVSSEPLTGTDLPTDTAVWLLG